MRKTLTILLTIAGMSCQQKQSTIDIIRDAVQRHEEKFIGRNQKIEVLNIDSLKYRPCSMRDAYFELQGVMFSGLYQKQKATAKGILEFEKDSAYVNKVKSWLKEIDANEKNLLDETYRQDTVENLFFVKYKVTGNGNKSSFNANRTEFLRQDDLTVLVALDSISDYFNYEALRPIK